LRRKAEVLTVIMAAAFFTFVSVGAGTATIRHCKASDFKLRQGPGASALAHFRQTVRLRNVSKTTCTMSGWFTVKLLNAHGKVLPSHEQRITSDMFGTSPKPTITIKKGGGASFAIDTTAPASSCAYSKAIAVTPPGGHGSARLNLKVQACPKFSILPVQPDDKAIHP
jgi:hypothetical protein